jgi:hypothetical protein
MPGRMRAISESANPRELIIINKGIIVTVNGIIIVASINIKIKFLPGKLSRANGYAARELITDEITVTETA